MRTPRRSGDRERTRVYIRDGRAPVPAKETTSRVMSANRGRDTTPEVSLRRRLTAAGLRGYRLHPKPLRGRPDIVFVASRLAVFVHGCFWHRCPHCNPSMPKTHVDFWTAKFAANVARDRIQVRALKEDGWTVLTFWECQIRDRPADAVGAVRTTLHSLSGRRL
jgi:DNA mismatch endonuclease, patch repair protein